MLSECLPRVSPGTGADTGVQHSCLLLPIKKDGGFLALPVAALGISGKPSALPVEFPGENKSHREVISVTLCWVVGTRLLHGKAFSCHFLNG